MAEVRRPQQRHTADNGGRATSLQNTQKVLTRRQTVPRDVNTIEGGAAQVADMLIRGAVFKHTSYTTALSADKGIRSIIYSCTVVAAQPKLERLESKDPTSCQAAEDGGGSAVILFFRP